MGLLSFIKELFYPNKENEEWNDWEQNVDKRVEEVEHAITLLEKNGEGFFECKGVRYPLHIIAEIYEGTVEGAYVSGYTYLLYLKCTSGVGSYGLYLSIDQEEEKQIAPGKLYHEDTIENTCSAYFGGGMEFEDKEDEYYCIKDGVIEIERGRLSVLSIKGELVIEHNQDEVPGRETLYFEFEGIPACFNYSDRE